jgi:hypothetical protein
MRYMWRLKERIAREVLAAARWYNAWQKLPHRGSG